LDYATTRAAVRATRSFGTLWEARTPQTSRDAPHPPAGYNHHALVAADTIDSQDPWLIATSLTWRSRAVCIALVCPCSRAPMVPAFQPRDAARARTGDATRQGLHDCAARLDSANPALRSPPARSILGREVAIGLAEARCGRLQAMEFRGGRRGVVIVQPADRSSRSTGLWSLCLRTASSLSTSHESSDIAGPRTRNPSQ
jgi:hypothetical protein